MSFTVYKLPTVSAALVAAAQRGVDLRIYLETPDSSEGKMAANTIHNLGPGVATQARVYVWPPHKRKKSNTGYQGVLHAKLAVADRRSLFVTSANLTGAAMHLNMEMGVLIRGGDEPGQVARHLDELVQRGDFELAPKPEHVPALSPEELQRWDEAIGFADEACQALLAAARLQGLPAPAVGFELVPAGGRGVAAEAELAWPERRVVVLLEDQVAAASAFTSAGWRAVALTQSSIHTALDALGA
jgi:phosphatidylserine/phosphatidylglycerophosphate/cardiolipin synthase-like enzyme